MKRVIVVGGGAAGMMAAVVAARQGRQVLLLEQNEKLGKKIFITGKGRCNVTNACEMEKLFENVVSNPKFLYSAFYTFDNRQMMDLLENAGCPLKVERGERVFPVSDHSSDIIAAMQRMLHKEQVEIRLHTKVTDLLWESDGDEESGGKRKVCGVCLADGAKERADAVILATGGLSYPSTGATGDGHRMAEAVGHRITDIKPALTPFETSEKWCADLQGLSLKNVELTMYDGKKTVYRGFGEMLFTHFGVSGPLILSASSFYGKCKKKEAVTLELDLKPALSTEQLDKRILRDFEENKNKQFKNVVGGLFPAKLTPVMITLTGILPEKKVHEITKEERGRLVYLTKHLTLHITGVRDFSEAIITQGGVSVKEVNPSTMESKLVKGLFFAGELLDVDALTGGFNLQIAWSTGYLAGEMGG
ncbi:MAG: NAD(P)/FAD-dependent oxidoreductase [Bacillus sp. (in: Bacteria)]|nr:NAD(P)/FAD-dependent oxidoreductase [Bacillus sp. (in: firmicutes)]MCM1427824.1 NAD(P)/FAD-dependent oxidoreductase [Eubacterium sp.]